MTSNFQKKYLHIHKTEPGMFVTFIANPYGIKVESFALYVHFPFALGIIANAAQGKRLVEYATYCHLTLS